MSYVEYGFLKLDEYLYKGFEEIAQESPDLARLASVPLTLLWAIESIVKPLFMLIEDFFNLLTLSENETHICFNACMLLISPLVIGVVLPIFLLGFLYDPLELIRAVMDYNQGELGKADIKVAIAFSNFFSDSPQRKVVGSMEALSDSYCDKHDIQDPEKRKEVLNAYEALKEHELLNYMNPDVVPDYLQSDDAEKLITSHWLPRQREAV